MIKEQLTAYELILDMMKGKTGHISRVTYAPQKPPFDGSFPVEQPFPRCTPEEQGVSSRYLASFIREMASLREVDIHGILVLRRGHVIGEYSFGPYKNHIWHIEHSLCKSITGMAVGFLVEEGKLSLDDRIVKLFPAAGIRGNMRQKKITVRHLLTMTSGVLFNEIGIVSGDDWVKAFLDSPVSGPPGEKFEYNSMNSYMLSAIVTELTGETLVEYLTPRLFEPLGIRNFFWESCPKGITKGGWGLFMCREDAAKLGQLYLDGGIWKGQQILPREWVEESTKAYVETPPMMGYYGYGYQIWMGGRPGSFNYNGMLGQNVVVYPDLDMVLVLNAASNELFQNCVLMQVVRKYFEKRKVGVTEENEPIYEEYQPPETLPPDLVGQRLLEETKRRLAADVREEMPLKGGWPQKRKGRKASGAGKTPERRMDMLNGRDYALNVQQAGIFPLIMQVFHNNFTDGIRQIGFRKEGLKSWLLLWEGEELFRLEIGFGKSAVSEITVHGESYLLAVRGSFARDEEDRLVLKLNIAFLEEAARRIIKCVFYGEEKIKVCFDERPGMDLIMEGLEGILQAASDKTFLKNLMEFGGISLPELLVGNTIQPEIWGRRRAEMSAPVTEAIPDPS